MCTKLLLVCKGKVGKYFKFNRYSGCAHDFRYLTYVTKYAESITIKSMLTRGCIHILCESLLRMPTGGID